MELEQRRSRPAGSSWIQLRSLRTRVEAPGGSSLPPVISGRAPSLAPRPPDHNSSLYLLPEEEDQGHGGRRYEVIPDKSRMFGRLAAPGGLETAAHAGRAASGQTRPGPDSGAGERKEERRFCLARCPTEQPPLTAAGAAPDHSSNLISLASPSVAVIHTDHHARRNAGR